MDDYIVPLDTDGAALAARFAQAVRDVLPQLLGSEGILRLRAQWGATPEPEQRLIANIDSVAAATWMILEHNWRTTDFDAISRHLLENYQLQGINSHAPLTTIEDVVRHCLCRVCAASLLNATPSIPTLEQISEEFQDALDVWTSPSVELHALVSLRVSYLDFSDSGVIGDWKLSNALSREQSAGLIFLRARDRFDPIPQPNAWLSRTFSQPKGPILKETNDQAQQETRAIVTAMRLMLHGHVFADRLVIIPSIRGLMSPTRTNQVWDLPALSPPLAAMSRPLASIWRHDLDKLAACAQSLTERWDAFRVSLSRFNWAFSRAAPHDPIIDAFISLESLLQATSSKKIPVALRASLALSDVRNPASTLQQVDELRKHRNELVHGSRHAAETDLEVAHQALDLVRDLLRAAIRFDTPRSFCESLDAQLFELVRSYKQPPSR